MSVNKESDDRRQLEDRQSLGGLARKRARSDIWKTVKNEKLEEALASGWTIRRKNKRSVSVKKERGPEDKLISQCWSVFYKMGFSYLSSERGVSLSSRSLTKERFEVAAVDDEMAVLADSVLSKKPKKVASKLQRLRKAKKAFAGLTRREAPSEKKRKVGAILLVREDDVEQFSEQANSLGVKLFTIRDLEYYQALCRHLGSAARFQFGADLFRNQTIPGLEITIPALRMRMGKTTCYCFAIKPEYLLKISYIAHRAKGSALDVDAYQRMIKKSRLKAIGEYISNDGTFPTNIVINLEKKKFVRFDQAQQVGADEGSDYGSLRISPEYGAAWIIDGQHRLYAYSDHPRRSTSYLNVLAYEGLTVSEQAQLFVDINSEQRRVKRSLLVELDADLKWTAPEEEKRAHAIASKAAMALDRGESGPLSGRVLFADMKRTELRCITITALVSALRKPGFFIGSKSKGFTIRGPLWRDDPQASLVRTKGPRKNKSRESYATLPVPL